MIVHPSLIFPWEGKALYFFDAKWRNMTSFASLANPISERNTELYLLREKWGRDERSFNTRSYWVCISTKLNADRWRTPLNNMLQDNQSKRPLSECCCGSSTQGSSFCSRSPTTPSWPPRSDSSPACESLSASPPRSTFRASGMSRSLFTRVVTPQLRYEPVTIH